MPHERKPFENPDTAQHAMTLLNELDVLDEYDEINYTRYQATIEAMKPLANESVLAAAFVDVETNSVISKMPEKIAATRNITKQVEELEATIATGTDDIGLTFAKERVAMFTTSLADDLRITTHPLRSDKTFPSASLIFHPWLATYSSTYGGRFASYIDRSYHDVETGSGGGSMVLNIPLHSLHEGVQPFGDVRLPAMTIGRQAVSDVYAGIAAKESAQFSTHHRSRMGSFAIWRLREQDESLTSDIDAITDEYGLRDIWADQYRDELAAKVAHVLKARATRGEGEVESQTEREQKFYGFAFLDEERELFTPSESDLRRAIITQCERLNILVSDVSVAKAVEHVWGDEPFA